MNMFSRVAVILNLFALSFILASYFLKQNKYFHFIVPIVLHSDVIYWGVLCVKVGFFIFVLTAVYILVMCLLIKVRTGKPPVGKMTIVYKFEYQENIQSSILAEIKRIFPSFKIVHLCYSSESSKSLGIAYGVILDEYLDVSDTLRAYAEHFGYSIVHTPAIQHAAYLTCPTLPWIFPALSAWLYWTILNRMYPELFYYTEKHKLSAYPVIEIYSNFSVILMAPLSRQDDFVVKEAMEIIHRASVSLGSTTNNSESLSHSTLSKTTLHSFQPSENIIRSKESKQSSYSLA